MSKIILVLSLCIATLTSFGFVRTTPVAGKQCMTVSSQHYATAVGLKILEQGGNAIDAAVAMGYALAVVHPCCGNIGGGGFMLIRFADGRTTFLNFREKAPHRISPKLFIDAKGKVINEYLSVGHVMGGLSKPYLGVGIPGTVMGLNLALTKYGSMSLQTVIQPAIKLAREGFTLDKGDVATLKTGETTFATEPNVAAIFLKNKHVLSRGEKLVQQDLANTLAQIAQNGNTVFYQGNIADQIVEASTERGGVLTKQDFMNYSVDEQSPVECDYRGYHIITTPPPGSGVTICEILKIVEPYPLKKLGFHTAKSAHYLIEAMRFSYIDRNNYLADPNFIPNPVIRLLSTEHIQKIREQIKPNRATPSSSIQFLNNTGEQQQTTAYVVVDKLGNAVSVTYTLNDYFGSKVISGNTGFFLNNTLADFTIKPNTPNDYGLVQGAQNLIAPNKRPLSSMSPTIITKNNKLFMVIGTPGGSTIPTQLVNVIINVIDYGMNIQEAENAPRFHMQWLPDKVFVDRYTFSPKTTRLLERMGYNFQLGSPYDTITWGAVAGIVVDPRTGIRYGAIDGRKSSGGAMSE